MHANRWDTNKSSKILNQRNINLTWWFVDKWEKPHKTKTPPCDFKVTTPKNPLIIDQVVKLNWIWSCSSLFSLDAQISNLWLTLYTDPNKWLTLATWIDVVGCTVLRFINNEDYEALSYKTLWRTNAIASHRENKSLGLCIHMWQLLK